MRIAILGNGRSGSSMLGMILGSHPLIKDVGEAYNLFPKFITKAKRDLIKKEGLCGVCGRQCKEWGVNSFNLDGIIVDTSKIVSWFKRVEDKNTKYIRLTRSVYDRLGSFKHKKGRITKEIVINWVKYEQQISNYLSKKQHFTVKYEELCQKKGLHEICGFIGVTGSDSMWNFWETLHHPVRGNSLTNLLVRLKHGLVTFDELKHKEIYFMNTIGFNVKYVDRTKHLDSSDLKLIGKYGGKVMNKEIGYC